MGKSKKYFCELCCSSFNREWSLRRHITRCQLRNSVIGDEQIEQNNESSNVDFDFDFLFDQSSPQVEEVTSQQQQQQHQENSSLINSQELNNILETARESEAEFSRDFLSRFEAAQERNDDDTFFSNIIPNTESIGSDHDFSNINIEDLFFLQNDLDDIQTDALTVDGLPPTSTGLPMNTSVINTEGEEELISPEESSTTVTDDRITDHITKTTKGFFCPYCNKKLSSKANRTYHMRICSNKDQTGAGNSNINDEDQTAAINETVYDGDEANNNNIRLVQTSINRMVKIYRRKVQANRGNIIPTIADLREFLDVIRSNHSIKFYFSVKLLYHQAKDPSHITNPPVIHTSNVYTFLDDDTMIPEQIESALKRIIDKIEAYERNGSGWVVDQLLSIDLAAVKYDPLNASSYIPLPKFVSSKNACVNVDNTDERCFMWAILAALYSCERNSQRHTHYRKHVSKLNFKGIPFPVLIKDVPKFETQNNISVNVIGYEDETFFPLFVSSNIEDGKKHVNLLYFSNGEGSTHYAWIKDLSKLLTKQLSNHNGQKYICMYCLHGFHKSSVQIEHTKICKQHGVQAVSYPKNNGIDDVISFTKIEHQLKLPFTIYADFECFLEKMTGEDDFNKKTKKSNIHKPSGFALHIVSSDPRFYKEPFVYFGEDAAEKFLDKLIEEVASLRKILARKIPMEELSSSQKKKHKETKNCYICGKPFPEGWTFDRNQIKVRDHNHVTGKYRGPAHSICNLQLRINPKKIKIPVVFHNLKGYDSHLILSAIKPEHGKTFCIPQSSEKYIGFSIGDITFIDSFQFMPSSMAKLASNLAKDQFLQVIRYLKSTTSNKDDNSMNVDGNDISGDYRDHRCYEEPNLSPRQTNEVEERFILLTRKGIYPYEYFDDITRFDETELPPRESFYSTLSEENVSEEDYNHAKNVWNKFEMESLKDYHNLYVLTDVLIMADVFEAFRKNCLQHYQLDPAHYFTAPGMSWEAALKKTGISLQLLTDPDQYLFVEKGIKGGISMITQRYAKANLEDLPNYDPTIKDTHLVYLDANNLYGWAMSQSLPIGNFQWLQDDEIEQFDVSIISDEAEDGFIIECDLDYPAILHDAHSEYPLAPERMEVAEDMLSPKQKEILRKENTEFKSYPKLVPNLFDKRKYVLHYRNLKCYLSLGMKLKSISRILTFKQSKWLKPYIEYNTIQRSRSTNDFEKDFFKLMNNSMFGKTMENMRKRRKVNLVTAPNSLRRFVAQPSFKKLHIFHENLVGVERIQQNIY
ncbi:uncharacterized protein [Clytia hemisphaerica]|uniref:uncharacterized protein n=1 Tax=Clytia hemisphaerica TaxID=252671 RepID=UPI0034D613BB